MEPSWDGGTKVCSNGPGHMPKTAAMSIYGKNLKKSSSLEPKRPMTFKLGMQHRVLKYYRGKVKFGPLCFYMGKVIQWIFQKLLQSMMSKLVDAVN